MIQPEQIAATMRWLLSLGPSVSIMEVLLECTADVERRATGELHALYALRDGTPSLSFPFAEVSMIDTTQGMAQPERARFLKERFLSRRPVHLP